MVAAAVVGAAPLRADEPDSAGALMWSLEPIVRPQPPEVANRGWVRNPIDAFLLKVLEAKGFSPAPPAAKDRLLRRLYFDLWGLPPTPDEVQAFVADEHSQAYERVVDRLLEHVHFGERWARYWLDLVRYADTNGYERDAEKPQAWKYRDWVVEALHQDLPYDRFVLEQLAGDQLPDPRPESLVATGFLRVGTFDDEPNDPLQYKYEQLDDLIHATATAFLATTLKCARCHDHKFDPIPQRDYYRVLACFAPGKPSEGTDILAFVDASGEAPPVELLKGGDPRSPGEVVEPGFLSMIPQLDEPLASPPAGADGTGRRLALARWIVDRRNPLTARVAVNRLWQHHFGRALVATSDNFGNTGVEPTHPELLDWLADELLAGGWRMKRLHKLIVMSSAYRMDARHPRQAELAAADPENLWYGCAARRRLDAEALRDAMLAVSGELDAAVGGPGFRATIGRDALEGLSKKDAAWEPSPAEAQRRRSLYMFHKRSLLLPLFTVFDFADTTQPCAQRSMTTVAPQALALLNNAFVVDRSRALARRAEREAGGDRRRQIERIWWLALGRAAGEDEIAAALAFLEAQRGALAARRSEPTALLDDPAAPSAGQRAAADEHAAPAEAGFAGESTAEARALDSLCHVVLNLNEFCYVD